MQTELNILTLMHIKLQKIAIRFGGSGLCMLMCLHTKTREQKMLQTLQWKNMSYKHTENIGFLTSFVPPDTEHECSLGRL